MISDRINYPFGTNFPTNLIELRIDGLSFRAFDARITRLQHLRVLSLNGNNIKCLPKSIENMTLVTLLLNYNSLKHWPPISENSPLSNSLRNLDIASNDISWLPDDFWVLKRLQNINLASEIFVDKIFLHTFMFTNFLGKW